MARGSIDGWPPRFLSKVSAADIKRGRGYDVVEFIEALCVVVKDSVAGPAGSPLVLRPWQKELTRRLYAVRADGRPLHRTALIGLPRKNGKSAWLSALALEALILGPEGGEVYSCAADRQQAHVVFGTAKEMVRRQPELADSLQVFRDSIYSPATGSVYRALSAEAFTKEGLSPTFVAFDEVHAQPNRELWDVMSLAMGARREPMLVGITTAGNRYDSSGRDSLCYQLYEYGKRVTAGEVDDPSFFFAWWEARAGAGYRDPRSWKSANPGFGDIVDPEDFQAAVMRTPEHEFRTKRLNMWVTTDMAWLPAGAWDSLAVRSRADIPGEEAVLALDGSFNNDSTALIRWRLGDDKPHLDIVGLWERPENAPPDWHVPVADVEQAIMAACREGNVTVREVVFDPARWMRTMQVLDEDGLPIVGYPQSATRMVPATQRFYEAVLNGSFTHSGDDRLARHVANCTTKQSTRGVMVAKSSSTKKIDAAVAAIFGYDRATATDSAYMDVAASIW